MTIVKLLGCLILYQVYTAGGYVDHRRPVWNIAHMVNSIAQIDEYLGLGANSIEFDVNFDKTGDALFTYHGVPCDCLRNCDYFENIENYLDYMRQLTTPGHPKFNEKLVLLFFDLKVKRMSPEVALKAGSSLAKKVLQYYWQRGGSGARAHALLSVPRADLWQVIQGFKNGLVEEGFGHYMKKVGVDFSGNEELHLIRRALRALNITERIWQGDGITNCWFRGTTRLREALEERNKPGLTYVGKVYWWTVDKMSTMRDTLRLGVDGLITNDPEDLVAVLGEEEFSRRFRLATIEDNPWKKLPMKTPALYAVDPNARGGDINIFADKKDGEDEEDEVLYNS